MIQAESFRALEASLAARLSEALRGLTHDLYSQVNTCIDSQDWDKAEELVQSLSLAGLLEGHREYVQYITNLAMLFGASRVTSNPANSVVGMGFELNTAHQMVSTLQQTIAQRGELQIKTVALQLIAARKNPDEVAKADSPAWDRPDLAIDPATGRRRRVLQPFSSFMDATGDSFLNIVSSLHTSRVSAYGFTAEAAALGIEEYQINEQLDSRTCPVCRKMHGKVFKVKDARAILDIVCRVTDPADIKQLQPWPKQDKESIAQLDSMSSKEIVAAGWHIPPFHPRCRGLLYRVGKVPTLDQLDQGKGRPESYVATSPDFEELGVKLPDASIAHWNTLVGKSPAEVVATLRGQSVEDFLASSVLTEDKAAHSGVYSLTAKKGIVTIGISAPLYGSSENVDQEVSIFPHSIALDMLTMAMVDQGQGIAKKYMQSLYSIAGDMGRGNLSLTANMELGGYAWAKYGFKPSPDQWTALKKDVWKGIKSSKALTGMSQPAKEALRAIMGSEDPSSIFFLSDISEKLPSGVSVGEQALAGTLWEGALDFSDSESMTRFLSYIGELK